MQPGSSWPSVPLSDASLLSEPGGWDSASSSWILTCVHRGRCWWATGHSIGQSAWPMDSRNSLPLLSQHWDYKCVCCHVWLSYGFWVSNSGPHAFTGLPLLSELSAYVISVVILLLNWYLILCIFTSLGFSRYVLVNLSVQKNSYALNGIYVGHVKVSFGNSDDNNDTFLLDYNW